MSVEPPFLISWNITRRCNQKCAHCYLDAGELEGRDEISTPEAFRFIDEIAGLSAGAMLVLTGGEPLLRPDILEVASLASSKGLTVVLGTNGTLLDKITIEKLLSSGVKGVGISLDAATPEFHDRFRGVDGSWAKTVEAIDALRGSGLSFQLQLTATKDNKDEIPTLLKFACEKGARAVNIFFLVCTGRGQRSTDLTPGEYEEILSYLAGAEREYYGALMVRARCAPHFLRIASVKDPENGLSRGGTSGCIAGRGYLRISPEGFVTPCPYMPVNERSQNLKDKGLKEIWEMDKDFVSLRNPAYSGRCGSCEYMESCGGCRARALASGNTLMGEDPLCAYEPKGKAVRGIDPVWSDDAAQRLHRVPIFLRPMVKKGVERYARHKGIGLITPEIMMELRKKAEK